MGGGYGAEHDKIIINPNFSKYYRKSYNSFLNKAKEKLERFKTIHSLN